jgi:hypothetical protein
MVLAKPNDSKIRLLKQVMVKLNTCIPVAKASGITLIMSETDEEVKDICAEAKLKSEFVAMLGAVVAEITLGTATFCSDTVVAFSAYLASLEFDSDGEKSFKTQAIACLVSQCRSSLESFIEPVWPCLAIISDLPEEESKTLTADIVKKVMQEAPKIVALEELAAFAHTLGTRHPILMIAFKGPAQHHILSSTVATIHFYDPIHYNKVIII